MHYNCDILYLQDKPAEYHSLFFWCMMLTNKVKTGGSILLIHIEDILPAEYSSRRVVSLDELYSLSDSIKSVGILNPLTVRKENNGCYRVVSGERRRRAAIIAGCTVLPCVLVDVSEYNSVIFNIAENLHRKELHYLELATIIDELHENMSVSELSEALSVPEGLILSRIRLLSLPDNVKWKIMTGNINETTANAIAGVEGSKRQNEITDLIVSSGCSFREAMELTEKVPKKAVFAAKYRDFRIFENTIEHAVETMKSSGISASSLKQSDDSSITYTITINRMV